MPLLCADDALTAAAEKAMISVVVSRRIPKQDTALEGVSQRRLPLMETNPMPPSPSQPNGNHSPPPPDAIDELLRRLQAYAERVASAWLEDTNDVLDAVQETLLAVLAALCKGMVVTRLLAFTAATARHKACDILRRRYRQDKAASAWHAQQDEGTDIHRGLELLSQVADPSCSHEECLAFDELVEIALRDFSEEMRRAFEAVVREGKSREEAAIICNCASGTVSRWLKQIWMRIQQLGER